MTGTLGSPRQLLVLGASSTPICGVRSHASRLNQALATIPGLSVSAIWWERQRRASPAAALLDLRSFLSDVRRTATDLRPDRVMVHYSVLSWASAGLPWAIPLLVRTLRSLGTPVTALLHEYAVPVDWAKPRSVAFGAAHHPALRLLLATCDTAVVTTEQRVHDLERRRSRPLRVTFIPVFSNIEPSALRSASTSKAFLFGIFGFGTPNYPAATVLGAVSKLLESGHDLRLRLIGAPGGTSGAGATWRRAAEAAGCEEVMEFTGVLSETAMSEHLAALDALIFPDPGGPAARKTTLAAGLAHGVPVLAFDGRQRWERLCASDAIVLVRPTIDGLTEASVRLIRDEHLRHTTGDRARRFYLAEMAPEIAARRLMGFVETEAGSSSARTGPR